MRTVMSLGGGDAEAEVSKKFDENLKFFGGAAAAGPAPAHRVRTEEIQGLCFKA